MARVLSALGLALVLGLSPNARGQAEAAPEDYRPPGQARPPEPTSPHGHGADRPPEPMWHLAVDPRLAVLLGRTNGLPRVGYGAGVEVGRALVSFGPMRFGVGFDFGYQRFSHDKTSTMGTGTEALSHTTFAARAIIDGLFRRLRPWVAAGAGLSIGTYGAPSSDAFPMGVSDTAVLPLVELALGLGIAVYGGIELGVHGAFNLTFSSGAVGGITPYAPGMFTAGLDVAFRF